MLGRLIAANNEGVVMNRAFAWWEGRISYCLRKRAGWGKEYHEKDNDLIEACKQHEAAYKRKNIGRHNIMLVHPFYLHLSHMHKVKSIEAKAEADQYVKNMMQLLGMRRKPSVGVVALETIHHYAACTSLLLEQGLVDKVIFTGYDSGMPMDTTELNHFSKVYFGGGYNNYCLYTSIKKMQSRTESKNIYGIHGMILESPIKRGSIISNSVSGVENMITIDKLVNKLGLKYC